MPAWLYPLLYLLIESYSSRRDAQVRFLKAQNQMLRSRLAGNRIILTPQERGRLLNLGERLGHRVEHVICIVTLKTYRRWVREQREGKQPGRVGRPRLRQDIRDAIVRFAKENARWGYRRIVGELLKLHAHTCKSTVSRVLADHGIYPDPSGKKDVGETPWQLFIQAHMNTLVACDFFCKTVWTPLGKRTAYCLFFIRLGSRKVFLSSATYHPDEAWVKQQARNVSMWLEDNDIQASHLIHDRDTKFTAGFDRILASQGTRIIKTPVCAPNANAYAESWVASIKRECLDHFLCFNRKHLDFIAQSYIDFYNRHRPHQGKGNRTLTFTGKPPPITDTPLGIIKCQRALGGVLKHYHRAA